MTTALEELKQLIRERFPEATFAISGGEDPEGVYLSPTIDIEDTDEVMDVVLDRLLGFQLEDGLSLYVVPLLPLERVAQQLRHGQRRELPPIRTRTA